VAVERLPCGSNLRQYQPRRCAFRSGVRRRRSRLCICSKPRQVEPELVSKITQQLPTQLEKYGVFVDAGFDELSPLLLNVVDRVQIHRSATCPASACAGICPFPRRISILRVLHYRITIPHLSSN